MKLLNDFNPGEKQLFFTLSILFIVFLLFRVVSGNYYLADSYEYLDVAEKIRHFSFFYTEQADSFTTKRPIVYPLFLALFYHFPPVVIVILQTLTGVVTFFLLLKILKKSGMEIKRSLLWFFIFTPSVFIYTQLIMAEWLVMFFLTLLFWLLLKKWTRKNFAIIQVITILLAFTKPVFYPLIYVNVIFFGFYFIRKRTFSVWLLLPVIVVQSYLFYNEARTGYRHFSSVENINLINYNIYYFKAKTEGRETAKLWKDSVYNSSYDEMNFAEKNNYLHGIAVTEIKQHFFRYSLYHFYTSVRGMFDPGRFDLMTFFKKEDGRQGFLEILNTKQPLSKLFQNKLAFIYILLLPVFLINLVKWFYFLRYLVLKKMEFKVYYMVVLFAGYIFITGPVNCSRYMMPFQGILIVFASLGLYGNRKEAPFGGKS